MTQSLRLAGYALLLASAAATANECTEDAMIVFDGSGSMSEMGFNTLDEPRIFSARRALREAMPRVEAFRRIGLITYGPARGDSCDSVTVRFPPQEQAAIPIITTIESLQPDGETPLTAAVAEAVGVLSGRSRSGAVVLVTDGQETCGGAPCQLAAELAADWPGMTVHVIGFKVRGERFSWEGEGATDFAQAVSVAQCLAEETGGMYLGTETVEELVAALQRTLGCPLFSRADDDRSPHRPAAGQGHEPRG